MRNTRIPLHIRYLQCLWRYWFTGSYTLEMFGPEDDWVKFTTHRAARAYELMNHHRNCGSS